MFFSILFLFLLLLLMLPIWTLNSVLMSISFHRRTKINHAKENQPNWIYFISQTYYSLHTHTHISIRFNFSVIFFVIDYTHFISLSSGEKDEKKNTCLFWKFESIIDSILRKNSFNNQNGFFLHRSPIVIWQIQFLSVEFRRQWIYLPKFPENVQTSHNISNRREINIFLSFFHFLLLFESFIMEALNWNWIYSILYTTTKKCASCRHISDMSIRKY